MKQVEAANPSPSAMWSGTRVADRNDILAQIGLSVGFIMASALVHELRSQ